MAEFKSEGAGEPGIHLFTIAGIRVIIDYSWFVVFFPVALSLSTGYLPQEYPGASALAYWAAGLVATIAFFLSILFHELAHSLVALRSGIEIPSITLFLFGGASRLSEEAKDPKTELTIAVVGPLSSFALGIFNLVPGLPLDGGRVLRAVVWWRTGSIDRATRLAADLGKGFAVTLMFLRAMLIFRGALLG